MFRGVSHLSLDAKGRMSFPSRYRDRLQSYCNGDLVVTVDPQGECLLVYPFPDWEEIEAKLMRLSGFNRKIRAVQRLIVGHAQEVSMDGNARILIPPTLRGFAKIDQKIALVGQGNKFELWDEGIWTSQCDSYLLEVPENLESVEELQGFSL